MEKMVREICLDSDILINLFRNETETLKIIKSLDAEFVTTSINIFELWYGKKKNEDIYKYLQHIKAHDFSEVSAIKAAKILSELKTKGEIIDHRDAFIGAICIIKNIEFLTNNKKHFERLKKFGLKLIQFYT
jgi:tRNA(fMet)-specific endonuclease VapC